VVYALVVGALIFVPLERLFALRPQQKIFRRGWRTDVVHVLFTRTLSDVATLILVGAVVLVLHGFVSPTFQGAVASQNAVLQFFEAVPNRKHRWLLGASPFARNSFSMAVSFSPSQHN
jgi:hypothetical protein